MEIESRFKIFRSEKIVLSFNIFSSPFNIDVETVPDELQMELIDLQSNNDLRNTFHSGYSKVLSKLHNFPKIPTVSH